MTLGSEKVDMPAWVAREFEKAACKGMDAEVFFPERGVNPYAEGKEICRECPIRTICLDWSLSKPEAHGLWGMMTPEERRAILRGGRWTRSQSSQFSSRT